MKAQPPGATASSGARPHSALGLSMAVVCALAASLPGVAAGLRVNHELWSGGLFNPDSAMRLVRLNDILAAGAPLHAVMRDGSGLGNVLPWSHLLDGLLLLLAAPTAMILGWHDALHLAALAFGPLCMAGLGIAVAWAAAPVAPRRFLWIGAAAVGSAPMVQAYGLLGVVHHHVLVTLAPVMAAGWALRLLLAKADERRTRQCGMALGAWAAAGIWFSPEALPFVLMAIGALWATWFGPAVARFDRPAIATAIAAASGTMTVLLTLAWLADPPAPGLLAVEPDRLSLPFVLLALGATATAIVARTSARRLPPLLCGAALAAGWLIAFPQFLRGTGGLMTPEEAHAFFDNIGEMEPVKSVGGAIEALLGGMFALATLCTFTLRAPAASRIPLGFSIACAAAMLLLASVHIRFAAYPSVAGAVLLPVVLASVSATAWTPARRSLSRASIAVLLITGPLMAPLAASAGPSTRPAVVGQACSLSGAIPLLATHPGEIVLANVNDTPDLLYRTPVRTVGSLYHRNPQGYMRLRAAWLEVPGDLPGPAILATGATLVLACPGETRSSVIDGALPTTLLDRLAANDPPPWLHSLGDAGPNGFILYAVGK